MSLFDNLVAHALKNQGELAPLLPVVEKELLHHDIIREMSAAGLLGALTFIGGTCLRACYGSNRLSEDLDFTGGKDFKRETLSKLGTVLVDQLYTKYGLRVEMSEPVKDTGNVDTWKLRMVTRPEQKELPSQRINIDVCAIPSYDKRPVVLRNLYGVDMGTSGLIIQAESREEILADKLIAFALRPNRLKNRDLWDIGWLKQNNVTLPLGLIPKKIMDHRRTVAEYLQQLSERAGSLRNDPGVRVAFIHEMKRFLPQKTVQSTVSNTDFWEYLVNVIQTECDQITQFLKAPAVSPVFAM
jgi:predicted nucleotidyltransferase component of viral defense system